MSRKKKNVREVGSMQNEKNEEFKEEEFNKFIFNYTLLNKNKKRVTIKTATPLGSDAQFKVLIDTGAEVNLIKPEVVPKNAVINRFKLQLRAANGSKIGIIGEAKIKINIERFVFEDIFIITRDITLRCRALLNMPY